MTIGSWEKALWICLKVHLVLFIWCILYLKHYGAYHFPDHILLSLNPLLSWDVLNWIARSHFCIWIQYNMDVSDAAFDAVCGGEVLACFTKCSRVFLINKINDLWRAGCFWRFSLSFATGATGECNNLFQSKTCWGYFSVGPVGVMIRVKLEKAGPLELDSWKLHFY